MASPDDCGRCPSTSSSSSCRPSTRDTENAPDYRIHAGDEDGPEVGAGWRRTGDKAGEYVSLQIDDPTFTQPLRANLFQSGSDRSAFHLLWTRPSRRENRS